MSWGQTAPRTAMLEEGIRSEVEKMTPNTMALAYTEPTGGEGQNISVLVVVQGVRKRVRRVPRTIEGAKVELLVVGRKLFESDVRSSSLLEIAAARLLLPHTALKGEGYLDQWERRYKGRKIRESLTGLVLEHPELSSELLIDPRYFVHDGLLKLSHTLPQAYDLLRALDDGELGLLKGYAGALEDLEREGIIHTVDGLVAVDGGFADAVLSKGISLFHQRTRVQRRLGDLLKLGLNDVADTLRPLPGFSLVEDFFSTAFWTSDLPRPDRFLKFPTATGLTPLSESASIDEIIDRLEPSGHAGDLRLQRFGNVLNEVYLLTYTADREGRRAIMKRYPNWVTLKWAPIALWTLGTRNFAVLGRSRMERECATTSLLRRNGIRVPEILHTSFEDRLLLREYVEGENLADIIKAALRGGGPSRRDGDLLRRVGETVAAVHEAGATLGDCKPENFIVTTDGVPVIVDLEQGSRGDSEAWDLAEFLYFSGHYAPPLDPLTGVAEAARCVIEGYIGGGGKRRRVAEAARLRYTKVFAPLTLPQVIYTIAKTCRMAGE